MIYNNKEKLSEQHETNTLEEEKKTLILYNDDYHSFDYVIDALIDICKHDEIQATQCTYLIHHKGHSDVKSGTYEFLKPLRNSLRSKDLKATIE